MTDGLLTGDAMRVTGTDKKQWKNGMHRSGLMPKLQGKSHVFGRDDLVALSIFNGLCAIDASPQTAARISSAALRIMRERPSCKAIYLVRGKDASGKPQARVVERVKAGDVELHCFRIAAYRAQAETDIAAALREARQTELHGA